MSGLLALLDDVAGIAKVAAASIDDIAGQAAKAGAKAAGAVIDDAAVTPKYVHGLPAARELPIVRRIATGSLRNKLLILLPAALVLSAFAPWLITPLLMLGGAYLCFEGAEKVAHAFGAHGLLGTHAHGASHTPESLDAAHLEETRVKGAIKTDFILSAEIMTIALAALPASGIVTQGVTLALVAVGITVVVYGAVALIVKADDVGLALANTPDQPTTQRIGRAIVAGMPGFLAGLAAVGTAAMLWVGGSILVHGLKDLGAPSLYEGIHAAAHAVGHSVELGSGLVEWAVTAICDGVIGLGVGLALIPVVEKLLIPLARGVRPKNAA
ncbi:MAG: DUF808 domain-containing protein [Pseudomonadota bacterium]